MEVRIWTNGILIHLYWEYKTVQLLWEMAVSYKHSLTYHSAIMLLGFLPNELKTYVHTKTCTCMFITALFRIARTWKQPDYPLVGEWINKLWYIQTMGYHSAMKRNELSSHEKTWSNLKCILLSERSQSSKVT